MRKLLLGLLFIVVTISNAITQCPLNIGESPIVSNNGLKLYFPFNGNISNQGLGNNTAFLSGATYNTPLSFQLIN